MDKDLKKRIDEANEKMVVEGDESSQNESEAQKPIDFYQAQKNASDALSVRPRTYGSPAQLAIIVKKIVDDFRQTNYNVSRNQYDHLIEYDSKNEAESLRKDYTLSEFLPLVEGIVENYGVDAIINNPKALESLDSVAISPNGEADGFTKSYLKKMHSGQKGEPSQSDTRVRFDLARARDMADRGDIRGGVQLATKVKEQIDKGKLSASEEDYNTLAEVSAYAK